MSFIFTNKKYFKYDKYNKNNQKIKKKNENKIYLSNQLNIL